MAASPTSLRAFQERRAHLRAYQGVRHGWSCVSLARHRFAVFLVRLRDRAIVQRGDWSLAAHDCVRTRNDDQRHEGRHHETSDDGAPQRSVLLAAFAGADRCRKHPEDHGERRHQDRAKPSTAGERRRGDRVDLLVLDPPVVREVDEEQAVRRGGDAAMAMIAPMKDSTLSVEPVRTSIQSTPESDAGMASMMRRQVDPRLEENDEQEVHERDRDEHSEPEARERARRMVSLCPAILMSTPGGSLPSRFTASPMSRATPPRSRPSTPQ